MAIDHPRFPTPEDEQRAARLYQALRQLAETGGDNLRGDGLATKSPAETG